MGDIGEKAALGAFPHFQQLQIHLHNLLEKCRKSLGFVSKRSEN
jgi:hypothetical protein